MICDRCYRPNDEGEHGLFVCPLEPRRESVATVIGDEWPGGGSKTFYNLDHVPVTCANKTEWRREMKKRGMRVAEGHVGAPGSDKSKFTTRWT